jgi:hypothetical protein
MAKAIKFNLILDGKPVRNLDDILDNFNIEDLLATFRNGSLKRWLETRELKEQIAALDNIKEDDIEAAMELCRIFHGNCTKEQLEKAAYPFEFKQKEDERLRQYKNLTEQKDEVIRAYHVGYEKLIKEIEGKDKDYPFIKSAIAEIFRSYIGLYKLDAQAFYRRFIEDHPLVILAMLANTDMRPLIANQPEEIYEDIDISALVRPRYKKSDIDLFLEKFNADNKQPGVQEITSSVAHLKLKKLNIPILILDGDNEESKGSIFDSGQLNQTHSFSPFTYAPLADICSPLPNHVRVFAGETDGYWKDVQPKGKRFLIIKMESGNFIRNAEKAGEELGSYSINGKFPIIDGIDYKSNNAAHRLVYMEV